VGERERNVCDTTNCLKGGREMYVIIDGSGSGSRLCPLHTGRERDVCLIINGFGYIVGGAHRHNSAQKVNSSPKL